MNAFIMVKSKIDIGYGMNMKYTFVRNYNLSLHFREE